jgi:hypothetical protein
MPQLVIADDLGFLGNRLIVCGHLMAFCLEHRFDLWMYNLRESAPNYRQLQHNVHCRFPAAGRSMWEFLPVHLARGLSRFSGRALRKSGLRAPAIQQITAAQPDPTRLTDTLLDDAFAERVRRKHCTILFGWRFRNYELFEKHQETIRTWNRLNSELEETVHHFLSGVREPGSTLVGVHIRRGDYRDFQGGKYYLDFDAFRQAMQHVKHDVIPDARFVIFSDETIDLSLFAGLPCVSAHGNVYVDMHSMAGCDYLMSVSSTFSRWASFLGRTPIYPKLHESLTPTLEDFQPAPH